MIIRLVPVLVVCWLCGRADAAIWNINGASCTPGDPAIQNNRYFITAGSVNYPSTATGLVTLYCPIQPQFLLAACFSGNVPLNNLLYLTYTDADGTGTDTSVTAQVIRLSVANGGLSTVTSALSSNSSSVTTPNKVTLSFAGTFDPTNFYYYVRVDLNRSTTSHIATFYGVGLGCDV